MKVVDEILVSVKSAMGTHKAPLSGYLILYGNNIILD